MANWWTLKILSGENEGKSFKLKPDRTIIGRVKGDVVLEKDEEASSVHAEIHYDVAKGVMVIEDLKSRNGIRVNGKRVKKRVLAAGDRVRIGITEMVLEPPTLEETVLRSYASEDDDVGEVSKKAPTSVKEKETSRSMSRKKHRKPASSESSADAAKEAVKKEVAEERKQSPLPTPREYNSYFSKFFGVLFHPVDFFDWMGDDTELAPALKFGTINWLIGGVLSGVLSYFSTYVWNFSAPGPDYGNSPAAIAISTLIGYACIPIVALVFHSLCLGIGGRAPFRRAIQITCFVSAVHFVTAILGVIPKVGPFLIIAGSVYSICVMTYAAVRMYHITTTGAYASGAAVSALTIAVLAHQQMDAKKIGAELTRERAETAKEIVVNAPNPDVPAEAAKTAEAPAPESVPPAAVTPPTDADAVAAAPPADTVAPAAEAVPAPEAQQQRDPAAAAAPAATTPAVTSPAAAPAPVPSAAATTDADDPAPPSFYGKPSE